MFKKGFARRATAASGGSQAVVPAEDMPSSQADGTGRAASSGSSTFPDYDSAMSNTSSDGSDGDINSSAYARKWRALMDLHNALNDLGAEAFFPLPRITVIGGQSAGKSSLVEAVSGLNVPRDAGVCTRCPMECIMKKTAGPWSCKITIRRVTEQAEEYTGQPSSVDFGPGITRKEDVDIWLRRAQAAVLSPHRSPEYFHNLSADQLKEPDPARLAFTRNTVVVNLEDSDLTNMSFVDLPGLISNAEQHFIDLVSDLVKNRISGENTIVLVTVPMTDDVETVAALKLAREADPEGQRTIAVLTKPDLVRAGATNSRERWRKIMEGGEAKHKLHHGYFGVLLPNDDDRAASLPREAMRTRSSAFFSTESPWKHMDQQRFGVANLVSYVGSLLVGLIEKSIPGLREAITKALRECKADLAALPVECTFDTESDINTYIVIQITKFCETFGHAIMGEPSSPHKDLVQTNRQHYLRFKEAIGRTRPDFRPFASKAEYRNPGFGVGEGTGPMDLADVREIIDKSIAWELPRHIPYEATKVLITRITAHWTGPALQCVTSVVKATGAKLEALIKAYFGQFNGLEDYVRSVVKAQLLVGSVHMEVSLSKALKLETGLPLFTQNTHYLETEEKKWLQQYASARYHSDRYRICQPRPVLQEAHPTDYESPTFGIGRRTPSPVRRTRTDEELDVMAKVQAYVQVAYKRIIDHVPLLVEHEFNQRLAEGLLEGLLRSFNTASVDAKRAMLAEDQKVAEKRAALKAKRERLMAIRRKLDNWEDRL
ncbi:P-loop containing nucleoside triphosphate hydrolase protein [Schizophyllum commune]